MTHDPIRQAVLADRRHVINECKRCIALWEGCVARQTNPTDKRFAQVELAASRQRLSWLNRQWREADRKASKSKRDHSSCYPQSNICAAQKGKDNWFCAAPKGHGGKHHACLNGNTRHEWADRKARRKR